MNKNESEEHSQVGSQVKNQPGSNGVGGVITIVTCFLVLLPTELGAPADPFTTPLEILPEWFLLPTFELLRAVDGGSTSCINHGTLD